MAIFCTDDYFLCANTLTKPPNIYFAELTLSPVALRVLRSAVNTTHMFRTRYVSLTSSLTSILGLVYHKQPYGLETVPSFAGSHVKFIGKRSALSCVLPKNIAVFS